MRVDKPAPHALCQINGFVIGSRNDYLGMKDFGLDKRGKSKLADGALVTRIMRVFPVGRLTCSSFYLFVMMNSLHHKEGHECHEQQPCYSDPAFCLYPHFLFVY